MGTRWRFAVVITLFCDVSSISRRWINKETQPRLEVAWWELIKTLKSNFGWSRIENCSQVEHSSKLTAISSNFSAMLAKPFELEIPQNYGNDASKPFAKSGWSSPARCRNINKVLRLRKFIDVSGNYIDASFDLSGAQQIDHKFHQLSLAKRHNCECHASSSHSSSSRGHFG